MDAETFMGASDAVAKGFADSVNESLKADGADAKNLDSRLMARRQTEAALAKAGYPRTMRSEMLTQLTNSPTRDAGQNSAARDAGVNAASLRELIDILKS